MYLIITLLILAGWFSQLLFIRAGDRNECIVATTYKSFASICFILLGIIGYINNPTLFTKLVSTGLVLGGLGDFWMELRHLSKDIEAISFVTGTVAFLMGHVLYIVALASVAVNTTLYILIGIGISIVVLRVLFSIVKVDMKLKALGVIYMSTISIMCGLAVSNGILFAVGAFAFVASDFSLVLYNFSDTYHRKNVRKFCLVTYYIAQTLIALSIIL